MLRLLRGNREYPRRNIFNLNEDRSFVILSDFHEKLHKTKISNGLTSLLDS